MSIGKRVAKSIIMMDDEDYEGALYEICSAIDATAKAELGKPGKASYKKFIHANMDLITSVALDNRRILNLHLAYHHPKVPKTPEGLCTFQEILYHAVRCGLYHEATLPANIRFIKECMLRVEDGVVELPASLIYGLITAVVLAPSNSAERITQPSIFNLGGHYPLLVNSIWGRRKEVMWLIDAAQATRAAIEERKLNGA